MRPTFIILLVTFCVMSVLLAALVLMASLGVPESRARTLREVPQAALATASGPGVRRDWVSRPNVPVPTSQARSEGIGTVLVTGRASWYEGSRGFHGIPHVATPHGRWTGQIEGWVRVCVLSTGACADLADVDRCGCYKGTDRERVIDLSLPALEELGLADETWRGLFRVSVEYL